MVCRSTRAEGTNGVYRVTNEAVPTWQKSENGFRCWRWHWHLRMKRAAQPHHSKIYFVPKVSGVGSGGAAKIQLSMMNVTTTTSHAYIIKRSLFSQPPPQCPPLHINPSRATNTTRSGLPSVIDMPWSTSNSGRIRASAHPAPLGGSGRCSSYSSYFCFGCPLPLARRRGREQSHRLYMPTGVCTIYSIGVVRGTDFVL